MSATLIGSSILVDGEIVGSDDVVVRGRIRGRVDSAGSVSVERGAAVDAEVRGREVVVAGTLSGEIASAGRVEIQSAAEVRANVRAARILIADGARFRGSVEMETGGRDGDE